MKDYGSPHVTEREDSIRLTWLNQTCLGGISCEVSALRILGVPNPRAYKIYLAEFHTASLKIDLGANAEPADVDRRLRGLYDHLAIALGPATFSYPDYSLGLPAIIWELPQMTIGLSPQTKKLAVFVEHEPAGYTELRAEAAAIRAAAGEGARVDFVAWPGWRNRSRELIE
ncbi:hypothetical protein [Anatilimnocola aggregata]|uniref:hypothetical protein n=1 Tax=Anatilimnocola aggregata TaxID=2528021 RepID=UPI0011A4612F|nr:hypothetical protein [Anatilimnocola aggregata]